MLYIVVSVPVHAILAFCLQEHMLSMCKKDVKQNVVTRLSLFGIYDDASHCITAASSQDSEMHESRASIHVINFFNKLDTPIMHFT